MSLPPDPNSISKPDFLSILERYPSLVPPKLQPLDRKRHTTIPAALAARRAAGDAHLTAPEVLDLVDWKLSHGTFRPRLRALVASNAAADVAGATRDAYALLLSADRRRALDRLTQLAGVGPATASLLLAVAEPDRVPFFSDEAFRWLGWGAEGAGGKGGEKEVWGRKIRYSVKEWEGLVGWSREVADRLGVGVGEVECVAWVLGREGGRKGKKRVEVRGEPEDHGEKRGAEEAGVGKEEKKGKRPSGRKAAGGGDEKPSGRAKVELSSEAQEPRRSKRLKVGE